MAEVDNDFLIAYTKYDPLSGNTLVIVVNLDFKYKQTGWITLPLKELNISNDQSFLAHDLVTGDRYIWQGEKNYVELNPTILPAHIFAIRKKMIKENQFDYFM